MRDRRRRPRLTQDRHSWEINAAAHRSPPSAGKANPPSVGPSSTPLSAALSSPPSAGKANPPSVQDNFWGGLHPTASCPVLSPIPATPTRWIVNGAGCEIREGRVMSDLCFPCPVFPSLLCPYLVFLSSFCVLISSLVSVCV